MTDAVTKPVTYAAATATAPQLGSGVVCHRTHLPNDLDLKLLADTFTMLARQRAGLLTDAEIVDWKYGPFAEAIAGITPQLGAVFAHHANIAGAGDEVIVDTIDGRAMQLTCDGTEVQVALADGSTHVFQGATDVQIITRSPKQGASLMTGLLRIAADLLCPPTVYRG